MSDLTAEMVRQLLSYDPHTGVFTWRVKPAPAIRAGSIAGRTDARGYSGINIRYKKYASHRLAWLYVTGEWPSQQIDHIDKNPSNNRFSNLRDVSGSDNCLNRDHPGKARAAATKGVTLLKSGRWQAQISVNAKVEYLGSFTTEADASAAYQARLSEVQL